MTTFDPQTVETAAGFQPEDWAGEENIADPICAIGSAKGRLIAWIETAAPGPLGQREPMALARISELTAIRADYERAVSKALSEASMSDLTAATQRLLADSYHYVSRPLLTLLDGFPRVALDLRDDLTRSLPIETAHRDGEPALFETTQLYRLDPSRGGIATTARPRRFVLAFHDAAVTDLDVIALEQSLIRWVSSTGGTAQAHVMLEPLIHVAGHDPTIPDDLVGPDCRAHVVLSGCGSLPTSLPPGVASAVGSLWAVDDVSSSSIMAAYHARLSLGIGPVEALRQAQLLHRHLPTGAWASYVHIGAPI